MNYEIFLGRMGGGTFIFWSVKTVWVETSSSIYLIYYWLIKPKSSKFGKKKKKKSNLH